MKILLTLLLILFFTTAEAQYILRPSSHLYYSMGANKSLSNYSGTIGLHYFYTDWFGTSLQTNFVRDLGFYYDLSPSKSKEFKIVGSIGYSAVYNSLSYSLRMCIQVRLFE